MIIFNFNISVKFLAVILLSTSFTICSYGQYFSNDEGKVLNEAIFDLIDSYKQFSSNRNGISTDENVVNILFSPKAKLYNDIIPANNRVNDISVKDYISDLNYFYPKGLTVRISNVQIGEPYLIDQNKYQLTFNLDKSVSGYTEYGINYEEVFNLRFNVSFVKDSSSFSNFRIDEIIGKPKGRYLILKFIRKKDKAYSGLPVTINHRAYESNNDGEVYLDNLPNRDIIIAVKQKKEDVIIKNNESFHIDSVFVVNRRTFSPQKDPNVKKFVVKKLNRDFKVNISAIIPYTNSFGFGETIKGSYGRPDIKLKNTMGGGFQLGFEFGQRILNKPSFDIYLRTGFKYCYSFSAVELSHDGSEYYTIHNDTINSFRYRSGIHIFDVPLGVEFIKSFNKFDFMIKPAIHLSMNNKGSYVIKGEMVNDNNVLNASKIHSPSTKVNIMAREIAEGVKVNYNLFLGIGKDIGNNRSLYAGPNFYLGNSFNTTYWHTPYSSTIDDLTEVRKHLNKIKIRSIMFEFGFRKKF